MDIEALYARILKYIRWRKIHFYKYDFDYGLVVGLEMILDWMEEAYPDIGKGLDEPREDSL